MIFDERYPAARRDDLSLPFYDSLVRLSWLTVKYLLLLVLLLTLSFFFAFSFFSFVKDQPITSRIVGVDLPTM